MKKQDKTLAIGSEFRKISKVPKCPCVTIYNAIPFMQCEYKTSIYFSGHSVLSMEEHDAFLAIRCCSRIIR